MRSLVGELIFYVSKLAIIVYVILACWRDAFNPLTLLVGRQEVHPAVKNSVVGFGHGYLSGVMCRFAYCPADATATHCLLLQ